MSLRDQIRKYRLYYKSYPLFRRVLQAPPQALRLPFGGGGDFIARNGIRFQLPSGLWEYLPTFCRFVEMGATPSLDGSRKKVVLQGLTLYSPLETKDDGVFYQEVFVDDVYQLKGRDLSGQVVVDIGGFVGDTAIAFARAGATVHTFEPSKRMVACLRDNVAGNSVPGRIVSYPVGLANRDATVVCGLDELTLVDGVPFVLANLPKDIDFLKLDCEGCEYHLLDDPRFLAHLNPRRIALEYHHDGEVLVPLLEAAGYRVEWREKTSPVGYMYAEKNR